MAEDFYKVLGVEKTASADEIKSAYRTLAKKWHPDVNPDNKVEAEEKFKNISDAYSTLSDESKRKKYDTGGNPNSWDGSYDPFAAYAEHFQRVHFRQASRKGADIRGIVEIPLAEAAKGCTKVIVIKRRTPCSTCSASGAKTVAQCRECDGTGWYTKTSNDGRLQTSSMMQCMECSGRGRVVTEACDACRGAGESVRDENIEVVIPDGVASNDVLRVKGKGSPGPGGDGDLLLIIKTLPHPVFTRVGNDLHCKLTIPFEKALAGGTERCTDLFGELFDLSIPAACKYGTKVSVGGKGIKNASIVVELEYSLPKLSVEQLEKVLEIISN